MLNIVVPMAGYGNRFAKSGYKLPKPLIEVFGKPMVKLVIDNITPNIEHRFIFICLHDHVKKFQIDQKLLSWVNNAIIISIDGITEGAASTVLLSSKFIDNNNPLMIVNCDQWINTSIDSYLYYMEKENADGLIMTIKANDPKFSFVKTVNNSVIGVYEKEVVSSEATVGIYNYKYGSDFVKSANSMIKKNIRTNNEFYIAPVYNELINNSGRVLYYNIGNVYKDMYCLGTPDDLDIYIRDKGSMYQDRPKLQYI